MLDTLRRLNWVDIVVLSVAVRICYIAASRGLLTELLKVLGALAAVYFSLHYYVVLNNTLQGKTGIGSIERDFFEVVCYMFLAAAAYALVAAVRRVFVKPAKEQEEPFFARLGGLAIGLVRAALLSSLILYGMVIAGVDYFKKSIDDSRLGKTVIKTAPDVYNFFWQNLTAKVAPEQKYNTAVSDVQQGIQQ